MRPYAWHPLNYHPLNNPSSHALNERSCLSFSVITEMLSLMTLFKKNWRRSMQLARVGGLPFRPHNWPSLPSCKRTREPQMMRVIEATLMDRRWQLILDCLDTEQAPFSKGTLVAFRKLLIEAQMDRRLVERTGLSLPAKLRNLGRRHYVRHWIAAHYGEPGESRIRTTW